MTDRINLQQVVAAASFTPSNRMIRARTEFHARNPVGTIPADLTLDQALAHGAPAAIGKWISTPGFIEWWSAPSWEREEAQRLLMQSMQRVSEILRDEENPATVIAAAREAREIYTKLHSSVAPKFADEEVAAMDRAQLEEYIRRKTAAVSGTSK